MLVCLSGVNILIKYYISQQSIGSYDDLPPLLVS